MRVWDVYFIEGSAWLFRVGVALLALHKKAILALNEFSKFIKFIEKELKGMTDPEPLLAEV